MHQSSLPKFRTLAAMAEAGNLRREDIPVLGYTRAGRPIYLVGGGDGTGDEGDDDGGTASGKPLAEMTAEEQAAYWRRQSRKHEKAAKAAPTAEELAQLREAKAELDKIGEANKSETEKIATRADKAEKRVAELEPKLLRLEVALDASLPKSLAHRLVGTTKEELEADAKDLLAIAGKGDGGSGISDSTRRGQDGGVRGSAKDTKLSARDQGLEEARRRFGTPDKAGQTA